MERSEGAEAIETDRLNPLDLEAGRDRGEEEGLAGEEEERGAARSGPAPAESEGGGGAGDGVRSLIQSY